MESRNDVNFVPLGQAAALIGISRPSLRKHVQSGALKTFVSPVDGRKRFIRLCNLADFRRPRPAQTVREHGQRQGVAAI